MKKRQSAFHSLAVILGLFLIVLAVKTELIHAENSQTMRKQTEVNASVIASGSCGTNLTWSLTDAGTLTIKGTGEMCSYDLDTYPWSDKKDSISKVIIQEGVTTVAEYAFNRFDNLTSVELPETMIRLEEGAFCLCEKLTSINLPAKLNFIGQAALSSCGFKTIHIPSSTTSFGLGFLSDNNNLESITVDQNNPILKGINGVLYGYGDFNTFIAGGNGEITDSITGWGLVLYPIAKKDQSYKMWDSAIVLSDCELKKNNYLKMIDLANVESIAASQIRCDFTISSNNTHFTMENGLLLSKDKKQLIKTLPSITERVSIPNTVERIREGAFEWCNCKSIVFPESVKTIDNYAVSNCKVKNITLPNSLKSLGSGAFYRDYYLEKINIPDGIRYIPDYCFEYCFALKTMQLHENIEEIGFQAFCDSGLREIIAEGVKTVEMSAFASCYGLVYAEFGSSLETINMHAFNGDHELKVVCFKGNAPDISNYEFYQVDNLSIVYDSASTGWDDLKKGYFENVPSLKWISYQCSNHKPIVTIKEKPCTEEDGYTTRCYNCGQIISLGGYYYEYGFEFDENGEVIRTGNKVTFNPIGHNYKEPVYIWSSDNASVTAKAICSNDELHVISETVKTTCVVEKEATKTEDGIGTYIAAFLNSMFKTQTKTVSIPKLKPTPTPTPVPKPSPTPTVAPAPEAVDMYRIYNPNSGEHFYTKDRKEMNALVNVHGWKYEGVGWVAPGKSNTPVYRLYNKTGGEHHYTTDKKERDALINKYGWTDEGIGWYSDDNKKVKVYREYNPNAFANNHNYTPDTKEHNALLNKYGWKDEGIAWYGIGGKK